MLKLKAKTALKFVAVARVYRDDWRDAWSRQITNKKEIKGEEKTRKSKYDC